MDNREVELKRLQDLIEKNANWIIQDRSGDHDYIRQEIRRLEGQRDALLAGVGVSDETRSIPRQIIPEGQEGQEQGATS